MRTTRLFLLMSLCFLLTCPVQAFEPVSPDSPLFDFQQKVFTTINQYWHAQELFIEYISQQEGYKLANYENATKVFEQMSLEAGKEALDSANKSQYGKLELLSDVYKSLPVPARVALYPMIGLIKFEMLHSNNSELTEELFRHYFPGYGYTEPGYRYRKGRETGREHLGTTWQEEQHSISTDLNVRLTVNIDVVNILKDLFTSGLISNLSISEPYSVNINNQPTLVFDVSFRRTTEITTKTVRRFDINKIWFELLRARSSFWGTGDWHLVGETYEIHHEPTGENVVTDLELK